MVCPPSCFCEVQAETGTTLFLIFPKQTYSTVIIILEMQTALGEMPLIHYSYSIPHIIHVKKYENELQSCKHHLLWVLAKKKKKYCFIVQMHTMIIYVSFSDTFEKKSE